MKMGDLGEYRIYNRRCCILPLSVESLTPVATH